MKFLLNTFIKYREALALSIFIASVPFVYFLRDGINLASNSQVFSIVLIFLPFALTLPFKSFKVFDAPNRVTFPLISFLFIFIFAYFILKDRYYFTVNYNTEISYFILILYVAFAVVFMRNTAIEKPFIYLLIFFTLISSISLIYYVSQNPFYVIGQRAAFSSTGETGAGNPHINSKGGFIGVILGVLCIKYYKTIKLGLIFPIGLIVLSIVVLFLTQTMLAFVSTFLFVVLFLVFNLSFKGAVSTLKTFLTKWYILVLLIAGVGTLIYQFNKNEKLIQPAIKYFEVRINGLKESFFEDEKKQKVVLTATGDDSANTRIMHIENVFLRLHESFDDGNYHYILFGQGYKFMYVDVPHLEMLDSFGLVGFVFFTIIFLRMIMMCVREVRNPDSMGSEFLAYFFIYFFFANMFSGQMLDYTRFATFFILVKFLKK